MGIQRGIKLSFHRLWILSCLEIRETVGFLRLRVLGAQEEEIPTLEELKDQTGIFEAAVDEGVHRLGNPKGLVYYHSYTCLASFGLASGVYGIIYREEEL